MMSVIFVLNVFMVTLFLLIQLALYSPGVLSDLQITSLESGFELLKHCSFLSSSFFLLAIIFVLFDMELILIFPFVFFAKMSSGKVISFLLIFFFIVITMFIEWAMIGLKWQS